MGMKMGLTNELHPLFFACKEENALREFCPQRTLRQAAMNENNPIPLPVSNDTRAFSSIADCALCTRIPEKATEDRKRNSGESIPPEAGRLQTVVELNDGETHAYASSTTRLLKCPECGTYYYWNHYEDEGEHFMDPTYDEVSMRRYGPLAAKDFLERISGGPVNALPVSPGQWCKAFSEGTPLPDTKITEGEAGKEIRAARKELAALGSRYDEIIRFLAELLGRKPLPRPFLDHAVESLIAHELMRESWESVSRSLFRHADPAVRVRAAEYVIGIGTNDTAPADLLHTESRLRKTLETEIAKPERMAELVELFLQAALAGGEDPRNSGEGGAYPGRLARGVRSLALYGLVVAAGHGGKLVHAIPALLGLLSGDRRADHDVVWVLRVMAESGGAAAKVLAEIAKVLKTIPPKAREGPEFKELVKMCGEKTKPEGKRAKKGKER
jgi:hypothetical protein